jgi:hypothetical protein
MGREYLDSFIREGGASVKFAVPLDESLRPAFEDGIRDRARAGGYLTAHVSAAETRAHLIDQIFYRIAEQMPWRELSERVIGSLAAAQGYAPPVSEGGTLAARLAASNGIGPEMLTMQARGWVEKGIFANRSLVRDFRIAVTQLCLAELSAGPDSAATTEGITDWLTGRNKAVSAVKPYQIYTRITRTNARHLFESLLRWIRLAGYAGLVVTLDLSRLSLPRNPRDGLYFYSKAQLLDAYEVLRQFVDLTDRMEGCLVVAMPEAGFLDVEPLSRGIGAYDALKFRVYDEVHDQRLVNPMGALIRLAHAEGPR